MQKSRAPLTLYLAPWQKRMMKDFVGKSALKGKLLKNITRIVIKPIVGRCPMSYKIPLEGIRKDEWLLYLTDEQMIIIRDYLGSRIPISSINISAKFIKSGNIAFR